MRLATSTNIYFERHNEPFIPMEETLHQCAKAGFKYIDFGFAELALVSDSFAKNNWKQELEEYIKLAKALGLQFVQAHATIFDYCNAGEDYHEKEQLFRHSLEGAGMMGIPWIVIHPSSHIVDGKIHSDTHVKNVEFLQQYASVAAEIGVGLAVENMWGRTDFGEKPYCLEAEELLKLIEDVGRANVKICWDFEHGSIEKLDQQKAILMLREHLVATHISDETGSENIHTLPYLGRADWKQIFEVLAKISYSGAFSFEIQHYLPGVPGELVPLAMRFAYEVGTQMVKQIQKSMKE